MSRLTIDEMREVSDRVDAEEAEKKYETFMWYFFLRVKDRKKWRVNWPIDSGSPLNYNCSNTWGGILLRRL